MDMILKTTDLCKNFKGQMAVNNVSLNIRRNSVYGLLGPNGAGKSTILKMVTGILRPTSGSIEFDGHPWKRNDLEHIGALIEMPPLYENLTAYENLKVRTTLLGLDDARINEVLQIVQLTNTGKKRAGQFSLGMKQRLGIAIALLNSPQRNSVYGLLGPNGAGKSTILKMLTGILRPTSGSIEFDGHPWKRNDLEHIGALIEMPPLYENLTAYENLKVRTTLLGLDDARINEVLQIVQLTNTGKKRAGQFSLGMKQRLGIAIALLNSPQLLILDEPTNGLDPLGIEELRELIRSFPCKGITVILSSHILSEVQQIADHVGIIAGGVLGYEGELRAGEDLEQLFMDVIRRNGKEGY